MLTSPRKYRVGQLKFIFQMFSFYFGDNENENSNKKNIVTKKVQF